MRRLRVSYEEDRLIPVDEEKLELVYRAHPGMNASRYELMVEKQLRAGDPTRQQLPFVIGNGGYETEMEDVEVSLEEQCERHPDVWFALNPKRTASCWRCASERRAKA